MRCYTCNAVTFPPDGTFDKSLTISSKYCSLDPQNTEAQQYSLLLREIFAYTYTDQYNP